MLITILLPAQHGQRRGNFIAGAIIAGDAIAGSLFLLWLDMMFAISSFNAQNTSGAPTTASNFTLGVLQAKFHQRDGRTLRAIGCYAITRRDLCAAAMSGKTS